jgi:hypothetical protein
MKTGDILYSSWGYEQTNIDFYEVVKASAKTVTVRKIKSAKTYTGDMTGKSEPMPGEYVGEEMRRKVLDYSGEFISINYCANARPYNGKPKNFSCYA